MKDTTKLWNFPEFFNISLYIYRGLVQKSRVGTHISPADFNAYIIKNTCANKMEKSSYF